MLLVDKFRVGRTKRRAAYLAVTALLSVPCLAAADEVFKATAGVTVPGVALKSFDISFVDPVIQTYVLGDRSHKAVDAVNTHDLTITELSASPPFAGATGNNNTSGPDGVIIIHHSEVWAGDGNSTVKVIDLISGATTHVISTGGSFRADEECFDADDNLVMVANNADSPPFASIISASDFTVKHKIPFDGTNGAPNSNNGAEQCSWSPRTGKFYISIPGIVGQPTGGGGVAVIEPKTGKVETTYILDETKCDTPQGEAVGPAPQIMIGCNNQSGLGPTTSGIIMNEENGHILAVIPNESGPDEVYYNEGDGQYFLARSNATGSNQFLGIVDADGKTADQSVVTGIKPPGLSAHSVASDSQTRRTFVPIPAGINPTSGPGTCAAVGQSDSVGCIAVFTAKHDDRPDFIVRHDDDDEFARRDDDHGNH
jgi:hypothetical protein